MSGAGEPPAGKSRAPSGVSPDALFGGPPQTYANRAASAIKTGAFARIGKALYGGSNSAQPSYGTSNAKIQSNFSPSPVSSSFELPDDAVGADYSRQYTARGGIVAMAPSPQRNAVAIVGKECKLAGGFEESNLMKYSLIERSNGLVDSFVSNTVFSVLTVSKNEIAAVQNLRGSSGSREFDKIYVATALKWGTQTYGRTIALSNSGGHIYLYNIERADPARSFAQFTDSNRAVNSLAFSPGAPSCLYSGTSDGTVRMWDLREGLRAPALTFIKNGDSAREIQCSPHDGKKFAVIYDSGVIQRWDIRQSSSHDRRLNAHTGVGLSIDWHPEKDFIVSGGRDRQIQVWNLSSESRNPDYVINAPTAVAKVRWLVDPSQNQRHILNSSIASCGRGKGDFALYVWSLRRPYIPVHAVEKHTDAITEVYYRRDKVIWTASKDKTFRQHNLATEELAVDNLSSSAFTWSAGNEISFAYQDKDRQSFMSEYSEPLLHQVSQALNDNSLSSTEIPTPSSRRGSTIEMSTSPVNRRMYSKSKTLPWEPPTSHVICSAAFPGHDPSVFSYCANEYHIFPRPGESLAERCVHNSQVCSKVQRPRTAQIWAILADSVFDDQRRFAAIKGNFVQARPSNRGMDSNRFLNAEAGVTNSPHKAALSKPMEKTNTSSGDSTNQSEKSDRSSWTSSTVEPMAIPDDSSAHNQGNQGLSESNSRYSTDLTGSSPEESFYGPKSLEGPRYTHISMTATSRRGSLFSNNSHGSNSTTDEQPLARSLARSAEWRRPLDDIQEDTVTDDAELVPFERREGAPKTVARESKLSAALLKKGSSISLDSVTAERESTIEDPIEAEYTENAPELSQSPYQQFLANQTSQWRTEMLVAHAANYAMEQGDLQMCAVLAAMFLDDYPHMCRSLKVAEEWITGYISLLKRQSLFVPAAELTKLSVFKSVRKQGQKDTSLDTLCPNCKAPLSENGNLVRPGTDPTDVGFWYCNSCKTRLDGCSICRRPLRGLALVIVECGHKTHSSCLKDWLLEGMSECPSGCGRVITTQ